MYKYKPKFKEMKKLIFVAVALLTAFTAKAQYYVGGNVGLEVNSTYLGVTVLPEVGYTLNEKMSVGAVLGFDIDNWKEDTKSLDVSIYPYLRYTFLEMGPVKLFADARVDLSLYRRRDYNNITDQWNDPVSGFDWGIGIAPGIAIPLTDQLSVVGHLGYFGYHYGTFELNADGNNLTVGLYYSF